MKEIELVNIAIKNIADTTNLKCRWIETNIPDEDGIIEFNIDGKPVRFNVEVKKELRYHHLHDIFLKANLKYPLIVMANKIFPKLKEELRQNNIGYIEAIGNVYFKAENIFIWIEGNKFQGIDKAIPNRAFTKTGLKVIFNLLLNDELINLPHREIAKIADVGLGNIILVFKGLTETGFLIRLNKGKYKLINKKQLLDRWITNYTERLKPTLELGTYSFLNNIDFAKWKQLATITANNEQIYWGGEPAGNILTNYLTPEILTIYTDELPKGLMHHYGIYPDPKGNVKIYRMFWHFADEDAGIVPALLVYTDLINTGESRCIETANIIFEKFLKGKYE